MGETSRHRVLLFRAIAPAIDPMTSPYSAGTGFRLQGNQYQSTFAIGPNRIGRSWPEGGSTSPFAAYEESRGQPRGEGQSRHLKRKAGIAQDALDQAGRTFDPFSQGVAASSVRPARRASCSTIEKRPGQAIVGGAAQLGRLRVIPQINREQCSNIRADSSRSAIPVLNRCVSLRGMPPHQHGRRLPARRLARSATSAARNPSRRRSAILGRNLPAWEKQRRAKSPPSTGADCPPPWTGRAAWLDDTVDRSQPPCSTTVAGHPARVVDHHDALATRPRESIATECRQHAPTDARATSHRLGGRWRTRGVLAAPAQRFQLPARPRRLELTSILARSPGSCANYFERLVVGSVVDDDQLERNTFLRQNAADRLGDMGCPVAGRHGDGQEWFGQRGRHGCLGLTSSLAPFRQSPQCFPGNKPDE